MNIYAVTPVSNSATAGKSNNTNSVPAFTGAIGDKFVREMMNGNNVSSKQILDAVKGTFGLKTEKVEDVLESLLDRISTLSAESKYRAQQLQDNTIAARKEIETVKQDAQNKINQVHEWNRTSIQAKDRELAAKDEEVKTAKEIAAKYEPMAKVKSIDEIGTVMPDEAIKTLDEMAENKEKSTASMVEYLLTGKGQEEALAQLNRAAVIEKARLDGVTNVTEVENKINSLQKEYRLYYVNNPQNLALEMIGNGLRWNPKGEYLASPAIREQLKTNAMGILTPLCDNNFYNTDIKATEKNLESIFEDVTKFRRGLSKGKEKLAKRYPGQEFKEEIVPYDIDASKIIAKEKYADGREFEVPYTYNQLSEWGNSGWS